MTRDQMLDRLTASEYEQLLALEQIEPWGDKADNLRFAVLMSLLVTMASDKNKTTIADWLKYFEPGHEKQQTPQQIMGMLRTLGG